MEHETIARRIVEEWAEHKNGSFSGSDLWSLIRDIASALKEAKQSS